MIINNNFYKLSNLKIKMGMSAVEIRIMPESPETNLAEIKKEIPKKLRDAKNIKIEEQEIAFGLKALKINFAWPEEIDTDIIENKLQEIEGVSSVKIEDIRRAFG